MMLPLPVKNLSREIAATYQLRSVGNVMVVTVGISPLKFATVVVVVEAATIVGKSISGDSIYATPNGLLVKLWCVFWCSCWVLTFQRYVLDPSRGFTISQFSSNASRRVCRTSLWSSIILGWYVSHVCARLPVFRYYQIRKNRIEIVLPRMGSNSLLPVNARRWLAE